jgi:ABC-type phosphate/phosphonate transport system substrate-binding protein
MKDLIGKILSLVIFTLLPSVYLKVVKYRQENYSTKLKSDLRNSFDDFIKNIEKNYDKLSEFVEKKRESLIISFRKNKITKDMFFFINEKLNEHIYITEIEYLKILFKDNPEILTTLQIILLDKKITQDEIYRIFNEIRTCNTLTKEQQESFISNITKNYTSKNNIISSEELFDSLHVKNLNIYKKRLMWYFGIGIPLLILLFSLTYIERYKMGITKADFTFGIVIYRDEEIVSEYAEKLMKYLSDETGKDIEVKYYSKVDLNEIFTDITNKTINGLIINPGVYTGIVENKPEILDEYMEVFAYHQKNEKDYFTNSVITLKSNFEEFCKNKGNPSESFDTKNYNDTVKNLVKEYISSGNIAFSDRYSMAGYIIPSTLWDEFQLYVSNESTQNDKGIVYTGSFDASLDGLINNKIHCAAVITERINEQPDEIKNKIVTLYSSTEVPYHPYLISKSLDTNLKMHIINSFKKLKRDDSKLARELKNNSMHITGWVECTSEEYYKKMENSLRMVIKRKLPKPELLIENISTIPEYKENLNELIRMLKPKINKLNAWELVESEKKHDSRDKYHIKLNFFKDILGKNQKAVIHGYLMKNNNIDSLLFELLPDSLNGEREKICLTLIQDIVRNIAPRVKISYDHNGLFIEKGRDNGFINCDIFFEGELIEPGNYVVEKTRTSFRFDKPKDINKYKDKYVYFKYKID